MNLQAMKIPIVLLLLLPFISCKRKTIDSLSYTPKMAGNHTWVGTFHYSSGTLDTTYNISWSESITILDNKTFVLPHHAFGRTTTKIY